jgi:hypothetical protein
MLDSLDLRALTGVVLFLLSILYRKRGIIRGRYLTSAQAKLSTVAILYGYRIDRATVAAPATARSQLHYGRGKKPPVLDDRSIGLGGMDGETVW